MLDYSQLTDRGKAARFRKVLIEALPMFLLKVCAVKFVSMASKSVFRLQTTNGGFAAKFHDPSEHLLSQMAGEMEFLRHVSSKSDLPVEIPFANSEGQLITEIVSRWLPRPAHLAICSWAPGRRLRDEMTARSYHHLGVCSAGLHQFSAGFRPSESFSILKNDRVFYWDEESLFTTDSAELLPEYRQNRFKQAAKVAEDMIRRRWQSGDKPIVIHNDLHPSNIKVNGDQLYIFDFEDISWGYPCQDIGTAMYHIRFSDDYPELLEAFRSGYEKKQPWPLNSDHELDCYIAARMLMLANYSLNYNIRPHVHLPKFEKQLTQLLRLD
jgi:amicoumacin kinase